ncbi:hypothetical protein O6H91_10G074200 [Diphasiastrum complanatum]|uniref:Uncharacterized protein n=2 Tax=Diphasiastrum complanatum TaxID=34168 RepID=A0ACC2CJ81_DIPCM|nr:hypothetical protein O6H91_10G073700 [Diphasiastrum complanatum]KAJ7541742.1 hypothetical protein O6H91_10G074200 [Diphasiastrum complanatum]
MVKKKTTRQKVRKKSAKQEIKDSRDRTSQSEGNVEDIQLSTVDNATSRVQKKIAKQLRFLARLQETASVLSARKTISKKRKVRRHDRGRKNIDLSSLAEFLPDLNEKSRDAKSVKVSKVFRNKARQEVVVKETKQLAAVLAHTAFQSNPFSAIQQHLINTLPKQAVPAKKPVAPHKKDKKPKKHKTPLDGRMDTT